MSIAAFLGPLIWSNTASGEGRSIPEDKSSAVILAYSRVGEDAYPETNIRIEQFLAHIEEITKDGYNVLPLPRIIESLKNGDALPPRSIGITFEGGYKSALNNAIPVLLDKNIPFTVFYASGQADSNSAQYLNWDDLKKLKNQPGVTLGILPATYMHLLDFPEDELRRQVNKALQRHRDVLSETPVFFSYPFGESSQDFEDIVENAGFEAAFGLHSGAIYTGSNFLSLPRFAMTENYGGLERFRLVSSALPLPVYDVEPYDTYLPLRKPVIGFSVDETLTASISQLSCFISGQSQPHIEILGSRVEIRAHEEILEDRVRINCTMPGPIVEPYKQALSWRWFGMLLVDKEKP